MTIYISDPKDIIVNVKKVIDEKGLKPIDLVELTENSEDPITASTARRFMEEGSEDKEFSFRHIIMPIANAVTDVKIIKVDDTPETIVMKEMLNAKAEIIKKLEADIEQLKKSIEDINKKHKDKIERINKEHEEDIKKWLHQIELKDERMDKLFISNEKKDLKIDEKDARIDVLMNDIQAIIHKCNNCEFHKQN